MYLTPHAKAMQLLERVANSIIEREPRYPNQFCFSANEVHIVEKWIKEFLLEIQEHKE
jgi:hypothetical protein